MWCPQGAAAGDYGDLQGSAGKTQKSAPSVASTTNTDMIRALEVEKPVVACINGACAGIGLVLALMCDVRFAADGAKFTTAFARRGQYPLI